MCQKQQHKIIFGYKKKINFHSLRGSNKTFLVFRQTWLSAMTLDSPGDTSSRVPQTQHNQNQLGSGPQALSMAKVVQGNSVAGPPNMRNFAKIMEDEKKQRNVLELKITKIRSESGPNPANLTYEALANFFLMF